MIVINKLINTSDHVADLVAIVQIVRLKAFSHEPSEFLSFQKISTQQMLFVFFFLNHRVISTCLF